VLRVGRQAEGRLTQLLRELVPSIP
jgi:hypothetical protein